MIYLPTEYPKPLQKLVQTEADRVLQVELEFGNVVFGEKPSEEGREPTINSTHIWRHLGESSPGHIGARGLSNTHHLFESCKCLYDSYDSYES